MEARPIEAEDVRFAWAAYKHGACKILGGALAVDGLTADQFQVEFIAEVTTRYAGAWTMLGETARGFRPVGFVFGVLSHPDLRYAPFMIVGDIIWMPWASARNKVESAVQFFYRQAIEMPMMEYAEPKDQKFFQIIARHGVMRAVGKSWNVYPDRPAYIFETRRPEWQLP